MMAGEFWFSNRQRAVIEPSLPRNQPGARRVDDRRALSAIVHVLRSGCRWQDCPAVYGPPTTIYNRFHHWSRRGLWQRMLQALAVAASGGVHLLCNTSAKAHRSAAGAKGGPRRRRSAAHVAGARPRPTRSPSSSASGLMGSRPWALLATTPSRPA
jgi:transposase